MPPDPLDKVTLNKKSVSKGKVEARGFTSKERIKINQLKKDIGKLQELQNNMQNDAYLAHRIKQQNSHNAKQFVTYLKSSKYTKVMTDLQELVDDILNGAEKNPRSKYTVERIKKAEMELNLMRNRIKYFTQKLNEDDATIIRNERQEFQTMFENFDQKANQFFNILSTVLKSMQETRSSIIRNLL